MALTFCFRSEITKENEEATARGPSASASCIGRFSFDPIFSGRRSNRRGSGVRREAVVVVSPDLGVERLAHLGFEEKKSRLTQNSTALVQKAFQKTPLVGLKHIDEQRALLDSIIKRHVRVRQRVEPFFGIFAFVGSRKVSL